jgi:hypothetical protein
MSTHYIHWTDNRKDLDGIHLVEVTLEQSELAFKEVKPT